MAARSASSVSRRQLAAVLGLTEDASRSALLSRAGTLCGLLEARAAALPEDSAAAAALEAELSGVLSGLADWLAESADSTAVSPADSGKEEPVALGSARSVRRAAKSEAGPPRRTLIGLAGALAACGLFVLAAQWWASEPPPSAEVPERIQPATLSISSRTPRSMLRVLDAETEELVFKEVTGEEALTLPPGRYAAEVSRADCPDVWRKTVTLGVGETKRFEASICQGTGELVVRSNVAGDRLLIDGLDVGSTGQAPHLIGVGEHVLRVTKSGFTPFEGRVRLRPDERLEVRAELLRAADAGQASGASPRQRASATAAAPEKAAQAKGAPKGSAPRRPAPRPSAPDLAGASARATGLAAAAGTSAPVPLPNPLPKGFEFDPDAVDGGSTTWHDRLRSRVLKRFDGDQSGRIDRLEETDAIPCSFWKQTESSFDEGGLGISMARLYGFDGSEWHPGALGFDQSQRAAAYTRMKACGLAE